MMTVIEGILLRRYCRIIQRSNQTNLHEFAWNESREIVVSDVRVRAKRGTYASRDQLMERRCRSGKSETR